MPTLTSPSISPRVLLSIDYEPWFAFIRRYDAITASQARQDLDDGFSHAAINDIMEQLGDVKASFYLVGEIAEWYPDVPRKIVAAGHELGLHCQIHRPLVSVAELEKDIHASRSWRDQFNVRGYRAPMVGISEDAYPLLKAAGLTYSSSIYARAGTLMQKSGIWELPVSTMRMFGQREVSLLAPRDFSLSLLLKGEMPYGSSFTIGVMSDVVFRIMERDLKRGLSPVIILHPYELVRPQDFLRRTFPDLVRHPELLPFVFDKSKFLKRLLQMFPVSPLGSYLDEVIALQQAAYA
ncbi:MAG: polysaccharide deacetylase family protein [Chloroflexota bacterium]